MEVKEKAAVVRIIELRIEYSLSWGHWDYGSSWGRGQWDLGGSRGERGGTIQVAVQEKEAVEEKEKHFF